MHASFAVRRALEVMRRHLEQPLSMVEIARRSNCSPRNLRRAFLAQGRRPPGDEYRQLRIEAALGQVQHSERSLTEIAHAYGFSDASHFTRAVRDAVGVTPGDYRKRAKLRELADLPPLPCEVRWRVGSPRGRSYFGYRGIVEYARRAESRSRGRIRIEPVALKDLGLRPRDSLRALRNGWIDAVMLVPGLQCGLPELESLLPQGVLANHEANQLIADPHLMISLRLLADNGLACVARTGDSAEQNLVLVSKRPVASLRQLRGLRLRHWSSDTAAGLRRLGVTCEAGTLALLRSELADGSIDAAVCMPSFAHEQQLQLVAPFVSQIIAVTRNYPYLIVTHRHRLAELSTDLRQIMVDVGDDMQFESDREWERAEADRHWMRRLDQSGFEVVDAFSADDKHAMQDVSVQEWSKTCASLGTGARANADRICAVLEMGS